LWQAPSARESAWWSPEGTTMKLIDEHAWERAEVVPIGEPLTVTEWLAKVDRLGMTLGMLQPQRIVGSPYDGGWVVGADNQRGRLYFAVPAATSVRQKRLTLSVSNTTTPSRPRHCRSPSRPCGPCIPTTAPRSVLSDHPESHTAAHCSITNNTPYPEPVLERLSSNGYICTTVPKGISGVWT
jgi:hypothetical protein